MGRKLVLDKYLSMFSKNNLIVKCLAEKSIGVGKSPCGSEYFEGCRPCTKKYVSAL